MGRKAGAPLVLTLIIALTTAGLAGCVGLDPAGGDATTPTNTGGGGGGGGGDGGDGGDGPPPDYGPQAAFRFTPDRPLEGEPVRFRDASAPGDAPVVAWSWEFGDGATATCDARGACTHPNGTSAGTIHNLPHAYREAGLYEVRLTVADDRGRESTARTAIVVQGDDPGGAPQREPEPGVVVAVIDTGVNPYHVDFRAEDAWAHPSRRIGGYPAGAKALPLTLNTTDFKAAVKADNGTWHAVERETLYWVPGTRVVGAISFADPHVSAPPHVLDEAGHGTATASAVARAAPHADLVAVHVTPGTLVEGVRWAAEQPYIDAISISWGAVANVPFDKASPAPFFDSVASVTDLAAASGKLVVVAAGNEPTSTTTDGHSGPPWVIAVGGADGDARGEVVVASKHPDVVADFHQRLADHDSVDGESLRSGTSFSAPLVAGTLAEAVLDVRRDLGHVGGVTGGALAAGEPGAGPLEDGRVTAGEVRAAMNLTAAYWTATDHAPPADPDRATVPVNPAAPWLQMGWGYVHPGLAGDIADELRGAGKAPAKPGEAAAYMGAVYQLRATQWG